MDKARLDQLAEAYTLGLKAGFAQPDELVSGHTYRDPNMNEAFDAGVNLGQVEAGGADPSNPLVRATDVATSKAKNDHE